MLLNPRRIPLETNEWLGVLDERENDMSQDRELTENKNPYFLLGFWSFAIISTLMIVFFPWSLLFCVIFYGLDETKLIVVALVHDAIKTLFAVASMILLVGGIIFAVVSL